MKGLVQVGTGTNYQVRKVIKLGEIRFREVLLYSQNQYVVFLLCRHFGCWFRRCQLRSYYRVPEQGNSTMK